ncbi:acyl-CoA thioesterase domain-containing protein [Bradyrhizobium sp. USDA 4473]
MAIFEPTATPHHWKPAALAAGPFAGLQGGAVASLLTGEIEAMAGARDWGTAISASAWFLRPTPMAELRTQISVVTEGGRVSVVDNTLWPAGEQQPCATVRVTLSRERAVEIPGFHEAVAEPVDPTRCFRCAVRTQ